MGATAVVAFTQEGNIMTETERKVVGTVKAYLGFTQAEDASVVAILRGADMLKKLIKLQDEIEGFWSGRP